MEPFNWSILIGGITFFFLGLSGARKELQFVAGDKLRSILAKVSDNRFKAFGFGVLITFLLQSSGATSILLISLADTHLLSLYQAIAILLGADFGTTFVVVLLSIKKIADIALPIIALGFFVQILSRQKRFKSAGSILLSFGLIFYGMHLMVFAASPLKDSELAMSVFRYLADNPLASLVMSTIIAAAVHSAGMIGIAIALAFAGAVSFEASIPLVLGANVGTCVTAILASLGTGSEGKRVAAAHTAAKLIGAAAAFPFIPQIAELVNKISGSFSNIITTLDTSVAGKIALTHILFNAALAVLIFPTIGFLVKFVKVVIPEPPVKVEEFKPLYLDKAALETPALAFAQAKREILRIASIAYNMLGDCLKMFSRGIDTNEEAERLQSEDDKIDLLDKATRFYLAELSSEKLSPEQTRIHVALLSITADLEEIGDTISKEMVMLARKKASWQRIFSDEGWRDLRSFQQKVMENFNLVISILTQPSEELAAKVYRHEEHIDEIEQQLRQAHINRLHQGLKESFDTSSIHLDILGSIRRINVKLAHIARMAMTQRV
jgi:phosphate:Na+ symporter